MHRLLPMWEWGIARGGPARVCQAGWSVISDGCPVARRGGPQRISFAFFMYLGVAVARKSDAACVGTCTYFFSKGSLRCRPSRWPPRRAPSTLPGMFLSGRQVAGVSSSNRAFHIAKLCSAQGLAGGEALQKIAWVGQWVSSMLQVDTRPGACSDGAPAVQNG